jgi:hypothetical protein
MEVQQRYGKSHKKANRNLKIKSSLNQIKIQLKATSTDWNMWTAEIQGSKIK